jgi:glutamate synthase domain-containing protein 2/glutamate synthase domain-containing protein 1/glutamate synthase domain-containing protein 3
MLKDKSIPQSNGMYSPEFEHDACGVGFVADIKGKKSHEIVQNGIEILENLKHRGAVGCDPKTGDGAGITTQIPHEFFKKECERLDIELPEAGNYGAGLVFLPTIAEDRHIVEHVIESTVEGEEQIFLGLRDVPVNDEEIGSVAKSVMPVFKHILVERGEDTNLEDFERKLVVIRKRIGLKIRSLEFGQKNYFYICNLSSKSLIYKGQLMAEQLRTFFPDLNNVDYKSSIALVHSRYSTNTFPTWALAHPFRMIAHNGEINTLKGNKNWFNAREGLFKGSEFKDDLIKIAPIIAPSKSDSAAFDNVLEALVHSGRSLPHALMMMIPEAFSAGIKMSEDKEAFYEYHSCLLEPWDGPSAICFTDGRYIGSILDRNGLRPLRYWVTDNGKIVMASETGTLDIEEKSVLKKGMIQPGKIFLVDTEEGKIIRDEEIKNDIVNKQDYKKWLDENLIILKDQKLEHTTPPDDAADVLTKQKIFGYTLEDIKYIIKPMAQEGKEATGSMGADTPLAILSKKPQLLFNYFKQQFAQVTNPPIDPIREEIVMSQQVMLGPEQNILEETPLHCKRLKLRRPVITNQGLNKIRSLENDNLKSETISLVYPINKIGGLERALSEVFIRTDKLVEQGVSLIILSDKGVDKNNLPIPSLLACSGLHHHLVKKGTRTKVSIVLETGEAREVHHFATLIGFGANAINPYLAFEIIRDHWNKGEFENISLDDAEENYLDAISKGLFKVISKMGISTIQSYCGAQIFEAVGLDLQVVQKYFTGTVSRIGGIGIDLVEKEARLKHDFAFSTSFPGLESGGIYSWREEGESHQWNPETIAMLQHAVRSNNYEIYKSYASKVNDTKKNYGQLRSYLRFKERKSIPIDEVEPAAEIVKRFATGAMSYGSISKEAHETLAIAMNKLGGFSNTGEGGEDPERFSVDKNGNLRRSKIKQIAQGRFGVTIEYLANADQLQIKMAQGAKPGEGGQLPGHKVSKEIAKTRYTTEGVGLISPPPHHDIYSIEDLAQLIYDLKKSNPTADVSVKLVSEAGVGTIAAGVSKGKADHLLISGYEGGTGASPLTSIKHAGLPMELGIAETQQVLVMNDLRTRIRVQVDGQLKSGRDVVIAAMLGADEFGFATSALISMGCIMLRKCHLNTCSVGIATQDKELRKEFRGTAEHVINYFNFIAEEVRETMAELGIRKFNDLIGKADYLRKAHKIEHWKAKHLDLSNILYRIDVPVKKPIYHSEKQVHTLDKSFDNRLIESSKKAIEKGIPVRFSAQVRNENRTIGTMLSSTIAKKYGLKGLRDDSITIDFEGSAGQSFGAFLSRGLTFNLEGDANDYVGKGLSGGKLVIKQHEESKLDPGKNIIVGNVVLYGAISGEAYINGKAGERFAVRNSGANVVVEGIGDHGCEYMTGGRVVILGNTGRNFAAGMSGGIAYVWDQKGEFGNLCNMEMVDLFSLESQEDKNELRGFIITHFEKTNSRAAKKVLDNWMEVESQFVKVFPKDYQRVLSKLHSEKKDEELLEENIN